VQAAPLGQVGLGPLPSLSVVADAIADVTQELRVIQVHWRLTPMVSYPMMT
jgi:hypothetical protein